MTIPVVRLVSVIVEIRVVVVVRVIAVVCIAGHFSVSRIQHLFTIEMRVIVRVIVLLWKVWIRLFIRVDPVLILAIIQVLNVSIGRNTMGFERMTRTLEVPRPSTRFLGVRQGTA